MTTVLVTRDYIIADKRTTLIINAEEICIDNRCKIEVDCTVVDEGMRIMAATSTGDVRASTHMKKLITNPKNTGIELSTLVTTLNSIPTHSDDSHNYELVCLREDGNYIVVSRGITHIDGLYGGSEVRMSIYRGSPTENSNDFDVFGSGTDVIDSLKNRLDLSELNSIDVFYFVAGIDSNSSNSYSVYSRITNELFVTIIPTKRDITQRINKVLKKIDFIDPKYKIKNAVMLF